MKTASLLFLLLISISTSAQQISKKQLLDNVNRAVTGFTEGQFTFIDKYTKLVTNEKPVHSTHTSHCFFKKNPSDSLIGFKLASFRTDGYEQIYDGVTLLTLFGWDKKLEVTPKANYPDKIKALTSTNAIYPFFLTINRWLQHHNEDSLRDKITLHEPEYVFGEKCYKLSISNPGNVKNGTESYVYISTKSFLPIRELTTMKSTVAKANEALIFDYAIRNIQAKALSPSQFSREKLSAYTIEKRYNPNEDDQLAELLPIGSAAPDWELPLLTSQKIKLSDLKGKVVIMDFWFKACGPCQKQMVALQKLHDKFDPNKVIFIGINTIDDPQKDKLEAFLRLRNITMPSVYKGKTIEPAYKVYGSPALFIIDQQGTIIHTISGASATLVNDVDRIVTQALTK